MELLDPRDFKQLDFECLSWLLAGMRVLKEIRLLLGLLLLPLTAERS